jgi:hypothetical protein
LKALCSPFSFQLLAHKGGLLGKKIVPTSRFGKAFAKPGLPCLAGGRKLVIIVLFFTWAGLGIALCMP